MTDNYRVLLLIRVLRLMFWDGVFLVLLTALLSGFSWFLHLFPVDTHDEFTLWAMRIILSIGPITAIACMTVKDALDWIRLTLAHREPGPAPSTAEVKP